MEKPGSGLRNRMVCNIETCSFRSLFSSIGIIENTVMKSVVLIVVGFIKKVEDMEGSSEFLFATALLHYCSLPQDGH